MNVVPILRYCATSSRVKSLSLASDCVNVCVFSYFLFPIHKITPCQNSKDKFAEISSYELVCYLYVSCMFWLGENLQNQNGFRKEILKRLCKYEIFRIMKYYFKGRNFWLVNGNCLEVMEEIPSDSVDMVFADPPYMLSNGGFTCQSGKAVSVNKGDWDKSNGVEADFEFHKTWISACRRILKPEGTLWVSGTYHSIFQCGYAIQQLGFKILNDITWFKPNASPNLSCRYFTASHENLIWAIKDAKAKHIFNYDDMRGGNFPEDFLKSKASRCVRSGR